MPPVGFEPTVSAGERPETYALERAATRDRQSTLCALEFLRFKILKVTVRAFNTGR